MLRRQFLTTFAASIVAAPFVSQAHAAASGGILARGAGPLIDVRAGRSMYEMSDPEPEPIPDDTVIDAPPQIEFATGVPELTMWNVHTDEQLRVQPAVATGVDMAALDRVNRFMRDWRRNEVKPIDANAVLGLLSIQQAARRNGFSDNVRFLSGYRSRATNDALRASGAAAARNSLHIQAKAIDFSLPGVSIRDTITMAKDLGIGGVGGYPTFVHIDSGRVRYWGTAA